MGIFPSEQRILNIDDLVSHGNIPGRQAMVQILEAGLEASDPYLNTKKLIHVNGNNLTIGSAEFEPAGSPVPGNQIFDLTKIDRIFVFGAGKGIQRVAKAIEDVLGTRLSGGHVIDKKGHPVILKNIGVTLGAHPVPDSDCVRGCLRIRQLASDLTEKDLVFTCVGNGVSALLTLPAPGIDIEDIRQITYSMQIEHGAGTGDLNMIRNTLDTMKSGRISRLFSKCHTIHILATEPGEYDQLLHHNLWLHTLPDDHTSYQGAINTLQQWNVWQEVPVAVKDFLVRADPLFSPVRSEEFEKMSFRIFGVMPGYRHTAKLYPAIAKAKELGFHTAILAEDAMGVEASQAGKIIAAMTRSIERIGQPFNPPCAIFSAGEMVVTVGKEHGIGGRNQEFTLSAALGISGSKNTVIASVDTDGTDGPGFQFRSVFEGMPNCLAGGIVDGHTVNEAMQFSIDINEQLRKHDTSLALWTLKNGIVARPNISLNDLTVALITGRS
jgi:glycerate 2-kinase